MTTLSTNSPTPRVLFVSQLFDPEPTFKGWPFAQALAESGFEVEVITGFPNYPGGKLYQGYKVRMLRRERMGDVNVTRLAIYPYHGRNVILRAFCYISFLISSAIYLVWRARSRDLIYVFYPAITAGLSALIAKAFRRAKVVIDIQDLWPDSLAATGVLNNGLARSAIDLLCRLQYKHADRLVVLSQGFQDTLIERGAGPEKVSVIYNWADETAETAAGEVDPQHLSTGFNVLFAGNMGAAQGLSTVIEAAAMVQHTRPDITFNLMGAGIEVERLKKEAAAATGNVRFLPRVPLQRVQAYLQKADCLLINLKDDELFAITIPSKTQAYLYAGRPVVIAAPGEAAALVSGAGAGVAVKPGDPGALAAAIVGVRDMSGQARSAMGRKGRKYYEAHLSFRQGVSAFTTLFRDLAAR